ncbi:MAG TPA: hypothetical protein VHR15_16790 [Ktedonobacterales bacterium]|nr:hypothetical protein [Ktedonobacterales bacterium]
MRRRQRYTVHRRLLLTFLLLGCAGSFVLGQEMARALAEIPVYAAQSLTFSGAGITASLVTPIQVSGAIGQPTPQAKVVKQPSKPTTKSKGNGPSSKPTTPKQSPAKSPPIVLPGTPVQVSPNASPCASASCLPGVKPAPPVVPPPATAPTGIASNETGASTGSLDGSSTASPSGAPPLQCEPHGLVSRHASPAQREMHARCASTMPANGVSPAKKPKPASPVVIATPGAIDAPQETLPAPVVNPVAPVPATNIDLAPPIQPADATILPPAGNSPLSSSATVSADPDDQNPALMPATPVTDQQPQS